MENCIRFPQLLKSEILSGLDVNFKKNFLNACGVRTYRSSTPIFEQGEPSDGMVLVAHGYVDVVYMGEDGRQLFLTRSKAGATLGETEAISDEPCAASCIASKDTMVLFGAVGMRLRGYLYMLSENVSKVMETQSYLASVVGCSRQTINRELAKLREEGHITQNGSEIIVVDRESLGAGLMD